MLQNLIDLRSFGEWQMRSMQQEVANEVRTIRWGV